MNAEIAYLFRHALLRQAAYQVQMPADRARLHGLALSVIEDLGGGRPPAPPPLDGAAEPSFSPHPTDPFAHELALHAKHAGTDPAVRRLYLRRSADHFERSFRWPEARAAWEEHASLSTGPDRLESLRKHGEAAQRSGDLPAAEAILRDAAAQAGLGGDRGREGLALGQLGAVLLEMARAAEAEEVSLRALAIHREAGNLSLLSPALGNLAIVRAESGNFEDADRFFREALAASTTRRMTGLSLGNYALFLQQRGRTVEAEKAFDEAIAAHRETGNVRSEGIALGNLAILYRQTGRAAESERALRAALAIHREIGDRRFEGIALGSLANACDEAGRPEDAQRVHEQALAIHRETGNRRFEGLALGNLGVVLHQLGSMEAAVRSLEQAVAIHRETRQRRFEGAHLCGLASVLASLGRGEEALREWRRGKAILAEADPRELARQRTEMRAACEKAGVSPLDA